MSLSSLLVTSEIATMRQVEEALARQVLYGGDFVTNLLEVAAVDEADLTRAAADIHALDAAIGPLPPPERRARTMIPAELASHRSIYPLESNDDGDELVVVVAEPLAPEDEEQLTFALGVPIIQRIAPLVRIREALHREFGAPLERRFERLLARLQGGRPQGDQRHGLSSSDLPPLLRDVPSPEQPPGLAEAQMPYRASRPPVSDVPPPPAVPTFPNAVPAHPSPWGRAGVGDRESGATRSVPPGVIQPRVEVAPPPPDPSRLATPSGPASPKASLLREAVVMPRPVRRRRGPLTLETATAELETLADRDQLLDLLFDFSRQYFEYSALFIVQGDLAEGREAFGAGASRDTVCGIGVPLDIPSIFATARDMRAPLIAKPDASGLDGVLMRDLERAAEHAVLCVPLVVRGRVVAVLYGDAGDVDVDRDAVSDVTTFVLLAGQTLERMILRRKLGGFTAGTSPGGGAFGASPGKLTDTSLVVSKRSTRNPSAEERALRAEALGRALFSGAANVTASTSTPPPSERRPVSAASGDAAPAAAAPVAEEAPERISYSESGWDEIAAALDADRAESASPAVEAAEAAGEAVQQPEGAWQPRDAVAPEETAHAEDEEEEIFSDDEDADIEVQLAPPSERELPVLEPVVLPPRTPPVPHADGEALPSVIVDVSHELESLVDRYLAGEEDDQAEGELLREGHQAMPVLMARFPGPITREPKVVENEIPFASACGPVLRLIAMQRRVALPWVLEFVDSRNEEKRYWATFLLRELAYVEAIPRLATRLLDVSDRVRRAARWAAAGMSRQHGEETARELGRVVRDPTADWQKRLTMLEVLEEIREPLAVPTFIAVLNDDSEDIAVAARRALLVVARQDFARDTRRWTQWWNANASRDRIEWLIDALVHESQAIRRAAGEELKAITKEYFGYYDDLPKRDRDRAQARYHEWWITEGRARFMRPT